MPRIFLFIVAALLLTVPSAFAQTADAPGVISGSIIDADYGGVVPAARVTLLETGQSIQTDINGRYNLSDLSPGTYTLLVSADFYRASTVEEIAVAAGETTRIEVPLYGDSEDVVELDEITVKAKALEGSNIALLADRQKSTSISDAIGSEAFGRLGIGDAADALSKTTGASVVDGKYVVIRGLSDRYNNTTLNGSSVPSADPDKRAVQLDQFPSGIIESIVTSKSFTPDKAGSFTGGSVNVVTKSVPDSFFLTLGFGMEYNENTTFDDYLTYSGGGDDWLGMDDGSRQIPQIVQDAESIPTNPVGQSPENLQFMDDVVRSFDNQLAPTLEEAPLNYSASIAFGDRYPLSKEAGGPVLGVIGSLNYKRKISTIDDGRVARYELVGRDLSLGASQDFAEQRSEDSAQWGSILNTALVINNSNEVGLKTMYNQSGEDEVIFRTGSFPEAVANDIFNVRNLHYTERTLYSLQAYGTHLFEDFRGAKVSWEATKSKSSQDEPDYRLFYDALPSGTTGRPTYTGNFPPPRRYWRSLDETSEQLKLDVSIPLGDRGGELKFGFDTLEIDRHFEERAFIYQDTGASLAYDGNPSTFLSDENLGLNADGQIQRYIREFIGPVPSYDGLQSVDAAYAMIDFRPFEKFRFIAGARLEDATIEVQSFQSNGQPFSNDGDLDNSDWLPAVQLVREINESQNLRFAYSKTLARPNFRELSPFGSFDNVGGEVFIGNPNLRRTLIENFDLRYEWFMEGSDILAVSVFRKDLQDPIELNYTEGQLTYVNVPEGEVQGVEFEARKKLPFLSGDTGEFSVGGNLSLLESTVDRSDQELADKRRRDPDTPETRELQGQSSLIGNMDLLYSRFRWGSSWSLVYNYTGDRLYSVSDSALPDVYEEPSSTLDFIYSQNLSKGLSMKIALKNILDDDTTKIWSDFESDLIYSTYKKGRTLSISFSKRFD